MTRIVSGRARGRRLAVPASGTRPTSDRVREAIFSSVESALRDEGRSWAATRVLDLFAGSGALGLEALSRGAAAVTLVERDRRAAGVLRANVAVVAEAPDDAAHVSVLVADVRMLARDRAPEAAAVCFADPPYDLPTAVLTQALADLVDAGWIARGALVVVERSSRDVGSPLPPGWDTGRHRTYGETAVWYGRPAGDGPPDSDDPDTGGGRGAARVERRESP